MRSVSLKPAYTPLTQQKMHCIPCSIQWILFRRKLPIFSQEEIGRALKLTVPKSLARLFGKRVYTATKEPKLGWGSQLGHSPALLNTFFRRKRLPLKVRCIPYSKLKNPAAFIEKCLKEGSDVMLVVYMAAVDKRSRFGHSLVISKITSGKKPMVTIGDPAFEAPKFYDVPLEKVLRGMSKKYDGTERAFYIVGHVSGQTHRYV